MDGGVGNISLIVVGGLAIILNLVEIILICKRRKNLKSYEQLLLSLSASDLVSGLTFFCLGILLSAIMKTREQRLITKMGVIMSFMLSAANLIFIGVDRLIAVRFPMKHNIWVTPRKTKFTIIIMRTVLVLLTAGLIWSSQASIVVLENSFHLIPFAILSGVILFTMIYAYIIYIVITRKNPTNSHHNEHRHQDKVLVITCASIVVMFIVCSCPIAFDILISNNARLPSSMFLMVNPMLDPPVYFFKHYYDKKTDIKRKHALEIQ